MELTALSVPAWITLLLAAALVGIAKTAVAGVGSVAVALFAMVLPARESTGALLLLLVGGDMVALSYYHRHAHWPTLWRLLPAVVPGLMLGAAFLTFASDRAMQVAIGVLILASVGYELWRRRRPRTAMRKTGGDLLVSESPAWRRALPTGLVAGFSTMTANAGGPVMTMYVLKTALPVAGMLGTLSWFFFAVNMAKVPVSASLGLITPGGLVLDLLLVPAMLAGGVIGAAVARRIERGRFELLSLCFSGLAAALLVLGT